MRRALTRLADAVEAGTISQFRNLDSELGKGNGIYGKRAYNGSLDAAKALHEAVLSGWDWSVDNLGRSPTCASVYDGAKTISAFNTDPARAWLLAIIRALAHVHG